jgi:hypothetical protein
VTILLGQNDGRHYYLTLFPLFSAYTISYLPLPMADITCIEMRIALPDWQNIVPCCIACCRLCSSRNAISRIATGNATQQSITAARFETFGQFVVVHRCPLFHDLCLNGGADQLFFAGTGVFEEDQAEMIQQSPSAPGW